MSLMCAALAASITATIAAPRRVFVGAHGQLHVGILGAASAVKLRLQLLDGAGIRAEEHHAVGGDGHHLRRIVVDARLEHLGGFGQRQLQRRAPA